MMCDNNTVLIILASFFIFAIFVVESAPSNIFDDRDDAITSHDAFALNGNNNNNAISGSTGNTILPESDTDRIIGGDKTERGEYPYFVWFERGCGGTLITPDVVLLAAHCTNQRGRKMFVNAYKADGSSYSQTETRICKVYINHPDYLKVYSTDLQFNVYDYALCKLNLPVYIDQSTTKLLLNTDPNQPVSTATAFGEEVDWSGDTLKVIGLGWIGFHYSPASTLNDVDVTYISNEQCNKSYIYNGVITSTMLCAGHKDGGKDACKGDSGGPIIQKIKNADKTYTHLHVGVVSFGKNCAEKNRPGVYARTSKAFAWIQQQTCDVLQTIDTGFCEMTIAPTPPPTPPTSPPTNVPTTTPLPTPSPTITTPPTMPLPTPPPTEAPVTSPTLPECEDTLQPFFEVYLKKNFQSLKRKNCDWVRKTDRKKRCELFLWNEKQQVKDVCGRSCRVCCEDESNYRFKNKGKACVEVSLLSDDHRKRFCNKKDNMKNRKRVKKFCPKACGKC